MVLITTGAGAPQNRFEPGGDLASGLAFGTQTGGAKRFRGPLWHYGQCRHGNRSGADAAPIVFVGGSATHGGRVRYPFAALVADQLDMPFSNLGVMHAGWDRISLDPLLLAEARQARLVVLQLIPPHLRSNPFYAVHGRRNDRFLRPFRPLQQMYPEVDFSQVSFVEPLIRQLHRVAPQRLERIWPIVEQSCASQILRLQRLIARPMVLLWVTQMQPSDQAGAPRGLLCPDMVRKGRVGAIPVLEVRIGPAYKASLSTERQVAPDGALSQRDHQAIAQALGDLLPRYL